MAAVLWVGAGGFLGAVGRYLLGLVPFEGDFPLMTFLVNFAGAVAVSYTHLDVYKRQAERLSIWKSLSGVAPTIICVD